MKKKIVIAILCAAVSMGTIGCGNSTASAKTTQTQTDKKEDSKSENSEKSSEEKQSRDIFAMDTYMTVTAYGEHASEAVEKAETEIKRLDGMLSTGNENSEVYKIKSKRGKLLFRMTRRTCMNALKKYINRQKEYLTYLSIRSWMHGDLQRRITGSLRRMN